MIVWGVISAATAGVKNFGGLIAVRFFLGFVEAAYFPGCLYYLSCWYTRKELGLRTAMLYSGALISGAFSGLISAGITANLDGAQGIAAWQWLFIIEGVATVGIAFISYFVLPNFPRTTSWLTEEERALAVWRLEEDIGEDDWIDSEHQSFWQGAKLAFSDVKTYVLVSRKSTPQETPHQQIIMETALLMCSQKTDGPAILLRGQRLRDQLLPDRGLHAGVQQRQLAPADGAAVRALRAHLVRQRLARRQDGRALLARHLAPGHQHGRQHHRRHHHLPGAPLPEHDAHGPGRLHGLRRRPRLDQQHPAPPARQARRGAGLYQRREQHELHLRLLHVSQLGRAALHCRHVGQLYHVLYRHLRRHGAAFHARPAEQEAGQGHLRRGRNQRGAWSGGEQWLQIQDLM